MHRLSLAFGLLGWLTLSACQSDSQPTDSRQAQLDLSQQAIISTVAGDHWAAIKLDLTPMIVPGETRYLGLSITPQAQARPFLVLISHITLPDGQGHPITPIFLALPDGESIGALIEFSSSEADDGAAMPTGARIELGLIFGSGEDTSEFRLGQLDSPLADDEIVVELAERSGADTRFASGQGGAAGSYLRLVDDEGRIQTLQAGLIDVETSVLAALPDQLSLLHQTSLSASAQSDEAVIATATLLGLPQTGLSDWDYQMTLPPYQLADQGQFLAAAGVPPPVGLSLLGLAPMAFFVLAESNGGELDLNSRYRYSGHEHSDLLDEASQADGGLVFTWGYLPRAALTAYGWDIQNILPGS